MFCDDCEGEVSASEQDKASFKEEVKVFKYKYLGKTQILEILQTQKACKFKYVLTKNTANTKYCNCEYWKTLQT